MKQNIGGGWGNTQRRAPLFYKILLIFYLLCECGLYKECACATLRLLHRLSSFEILRLGVSNTETRPKIPPPHSHSLHFFVVHFFIVSGFIIISVLDISFRMTDAMSSLSCQPSEWLVRMQKHRFRSGTSWVCKQ